MENDFVLIAACLPSVPPAFAAFRRFTGLHSSVRNSKSGFQSLKAGAHHAGLEEHVLEIARNGQLPGPTNQSIHVNYDFSLQEEQAGPKGHEVPIHAVGA